MLAHVDAFSDADAAELADLDRQFGRRGSATASINLDIAELERLAGRRLPELRAGALDTGAERDRSRTRHRPGEVAGVSSTSHADLE